MKKFLFALVILSSMSVSAATELEFKHESVSYSYCSMNTGYAIDIQRLTNLQSRDVFFRIEQGNGTFYPNIVITNTDKRGIARSTPMKFDAQDCLNMKKCIDQFGSQKLAVASTCTEGLLEIKFIID